MVSAVLLPNAKACFITSAGLPAVGYLLYTYDAGTLVPRTTYLDAAGLANNTNPIVLDARGEAVIYWDGSYKVILKDPSNVTIWTADNVSQGPLSNPVPWAAAAGTDAITAAYAPAITALTDGLLLTFRSAGANTIAAPTFSPNGLTARAITKFGGRALLLGDIPRANFEALVRYNLANTRWELLNPVNTRNIFKSFAGFSPSNTGSVVKVMKGLGATWTLTPRSSGVVRITVCGYTTNTGTGNAQFNAAYGTGVAPIDGAALTGTLFDTVDTLATSAVAGLAPANDFCFISEASGLTLGTAYWFDMPLAASSATSAITITSVIIEELPAP